MDTLDFLPLGGTGEIGMNLNLYGYRGRWLMVDAGVMFERTPGGGTRVLLPDPTFISARRDRLDGLVITHAHQDHLGAVADLWPRLRCPVYVTPFAAAMLEGPLAEAGLRDRVPIRVLPETARFTVGPFTLQRIPFTHSTVEMGALLIRTDAATVLHTGDFKLDPDPVAGRRTDWVALDRLAGRIDVVVSDSTNADVDGWTPSEGLLFEAFHDLFRGRDGMICVTLFSSNVARIKTLSQVAHVVGRDLVFVGRSLERTVMAARKAGYLDDLPPVVPARHVGYLPRDRVLVVCTGSQGEQRAGLSRIAADAHPHVSLEEGDLVVFSARAIPGNEVSLQRLHHLLRAERRVEVVTAEDAPQLVHVSGHPCRDELVALYERLRPRAVLPVHGTPTKLDAHAGLARAMGLDAIRIRNGQRVHLTGRGHRVGEWVRTGRIERPERVVDRGHRPPRR